MNNSDKILTIFYDGLCHLCSREIDHYKKQVGSERVSFVDITDSSFDAKANGLDPKKIHQVMHVRDPEGNLKTGVDAFIAIWDFLPGYKKLSGLARWPFIRPVLDLGYNLFAKIRPWLPKKKKLCDSSPYCDLGDGK